MKPKTLVEKQAPGAGSGLSQEVWLHSVMKVKESHGSWDGQDGMNTSICSWECGGGNRAVFPLQNASTSNTGDPTQICTVGEKTATCFKHRLERILFSVFVVHGLTLVVAAE